MLDSVKIIRTQKFDLKSTEHVGEHLLFAESSVKINTKPEKIYIKSLLKGIDILWVEGENNGNAKVHSRSIPLINFDLDPYGSMMRKDQHHTIFEVGFGYVAAMVANTMQKNPQDFNTHFANAGTLVWDKKECYQIVISYPEYKYVEYVVKKGETTTSIAKKFGTNDFKLRYKNNLSSYFGSIKEGKKLLIPTPYSNKGIILIDKKTFLPINVKIYDEEGLFEAYEFYNIRINQTFMSDEFLKTYKDYGF
jgi:LysM repeat protein